MGRNRFLAGGAALAVCLCAGAALAQSIVIDLPVRAGGLIFFPTVEDEKVFYYAPTRARLARSESGTPEFSFLRYVENVRSEESTREGSGGGIVHALVQLGVSEEERENAERELGRIVSGAGVAGPAIFRSGKFGLVSSFQEENGDFTRQVVGLGSAPILDGSKAAVSIQLTVKGAKVLWQSFHTATPDVSFLFEMELAGYRAPKRAVIEADLDQVYQHKSFELGVATTYLQAEISDAFSDLRRSGAIRLTQVGEDEDLGALIQSAYSKLTELIFQPDHGLAEVPASGRKSALDRASERLEQHRAEVREENADIRRENARLRQRAREEHERLRREAEEARAAAAAGGDDALDASRRAAFLGALGGVAGLMEASLEEPEAPPLAPEVPGLGEEQALPDFAAVVSYEMKQSRQRGTYHVDLGKYTADTLSVRFDENIGDLRKYLDDEAIFRNVNLDDPLYRQREVTASLAGVDAGSFDDALAFVSVQLRKKHGNGEETFEELRIDREAFNAHGNRFKLAYGWKGDTNRRTWQRYEYRTFWSFASGEPIGEHWRQASFNAIQLTPPYAKRTIQLEGIEAPLKAQQVRSVSVTVYSQLPGEERAVSTSLNVGRGELSKTLDFLLPADQFEYDYEIRWRLRGGVTHTTGRQTTDQDILYVDDIPEPEPEEPEPEEDLPEASEAGEVEGASSGGI